MPPHNLTYTPLGAMLLWLGWFALMPGVPWQRISCCCSIYGDSHGRCFGLLGVVFDGVVEPWPSDFAGSMLRCCRWVGRGLLRPAGPAHI